MTKPPGGDVNNTLQKPFGLVQGNNINRSDYLYDKNRLHRYNLLYLLDELETQLDFI